MLLATRLLLLVVVVIVKCSVATPLASAAAAVSDKQHHSAAAAAASPTAPKILTAGPAGVSGPAPASLAAAKPAPKAAGQRGFAEDLPMMDGTGFSGGNDYGNNDGQYSMEAESFYHHGGGGGGGADYGDDPYGGGEGGADYEGEEGDDNYDGEADYQLPSSSRSDKGSDYAADDDAGGEDYYMVPPFYGHRRRGGDYLSEQAPAIPLDKVEKVKGLHKVDRALPLDSVQELIGDVRQLKDVQRVAGLEEIQSIVPIPEEVAKKFIRDKGLKTLRPGELGHSGGSGGSVHSFGGGHRGAGGVRKGGGGDGEFEKELIDLLAEEDGAKKGFKTPVSSGDQIVPKRPRTADYKSAQPVHGDAGDSVKGLQRILNLFGIKSLDQITDVIPVDSIREIDPPSQKRRGEKRRGSDSEDFSTAGHHPLPATSLDESSKRRSGSGDDFRSVRYPPPATAGDESEVKHTANGGVGDGGKLTDSLTPIQASLAREEKAADLLSAALKRQGDKIKAMQRVKQIHDVKRLEAVKRLEEVKRLLEVSGLKEVKSLQKVKNVSDVKAVHPVVSMTEVKEIFPLSSAEAAELKAASRQYNGGSSNA